MRYLAVIPARGGSKRIPHKNVKMLDGQPMIAYTIKDAAGCNKITRCVVSTDSEEIASIAKKFGAEVPFLRPKEISGDSASTEDVLCHALKFFEDRGENFDAVILLQVTSPIRKPGRIQQGIEKFENEKADALMSVVKVPPFLWKNLYAPEPLYNFKNRPRTQDITIQDTLFIENGSFSISKTWVLKECKNRLAGKIVAFEMDPCESFDIDNEEDFKIVEKLIKESR